MQPADENIDTSSVFTSICVMNKEVCAKIQQAIRPHEDLTIIK